MVGRRRGSRWVEETHPNRLKEVMGVLEPSYVDLSGEGVAELSHDELHRVRTQTVIHTIIELGILLFVFINHHLKCKNMRTYTLILS